MNDTSPCTRNEFLSAAMRWALAGALGAAVVFLWERGNLVPDCSGACPVCPHFAQCGDPAKSERNTP